MSAPRKLILAINAGSSSLKISVFKINADGPTELLVTSFSNISSPPALFSSSVASSETSKDTKKKEELEDVKDHESAFEYFLKYLQESTSLSSKEIIYVCHRVVHGGDYPGPVLISRESYHYIEKLTDLAPL